jgi:hypothetical protein
MEIVNTTSTTDPVNMYNNMNTFILNPIVFIIVLIIIVYYVFFTSLGNNNNNNTGMSMNFNTGSDDSKSSIFSYVIIGILIVLIVVNVFQYFFSINVSAYISGLFTPKTSVDIVVDEGSNVNNNIPQIKFKKQVFNIPGNYYGYEDAKALCAAYGAELADYNQIEKAYNDGAEWCNYGWSANQLALFPTQQKTFDHLQSVKGHENDCGRTGINGGYIANKKVQFGANCYGYRPRMTEEEEELMKTDSPFPETPKDIAFQKRVDYWKTRIDEILVSPFNHNTWGSF